MNKIKNTSVTNIVIPLIAIVIYLIFGVMSFPTEGKTSSFNVLYYVVCAIFTMTVMIFLYKKELKEDFKAFSKKFVKNILICFSIMLILYAILCVANNFIYYAFGYSKISTDSIVFPNMNNLIFYTMFVMVIYNPFIESIIFNLSLKKIINNKILFIVISAVLFGFMQVGMQMSMIVYSIPYVLIGAVMALLYEKKKNIFFPIFTWVIYYAIQLFIQSSAYWA